MKSAFFIISVFLSSLFFACQNDVSTGPTKDLIVVRGYIYTDEPVWDIQITHTLDLGSSDSTAPPINDASVAIYKAGNRYDLVASEGDSGYYHYPGDDLNIHIGDEVSITVDYQDQHVEGSTTAPQPPSGLVLEKDTLYVPTFTGFPGGGGFDRSAMEMTVTWDENPEALFYVVVENIEQNPTPIESRFPGKRPGGRFVFPPTNRNDYRLNAMSFTHYGKHLVRVYRVNQEYADLYGSRNQDSRDLNEPLTNISGGLGIFSAFSSVTGVFVVAPQP